MNQCACCVARSVARRHYDCHVDSTTTRTIVTGVPDAIPIVGPSLVELLRGGIGVGQATLTRFYSLHTFVLPLLTAVFMLIHFLIIRKQGISGPL